MEIEKISHTGLILYVKLTIHTCVSMVRYQCSMKKEVIQNIVCELRTKSGVTQEGFASAIGVTRQTVIAIEKGNYTPSVLLALKIALFFKKRVEDIFVITYEK